MALTIVPQKAPSPRSDRQIFSSSDDSAMMKQIQATHTPDGREFAASPLLHIVDDIFQRTTTVVAGLVQHEGVQQQAQLDALEERAQDGLSEMLELLSHTISKIACEISCKCSGGGDANTTILAIFNQLSNYTWDAKVALALAAFAVNYGEFWLVAQLYLSNPLAKAVALLKQLPDILERADTLKPKFDALNNLIRTMKDVAKCIVEFKELPSQYITPDTPEMATATAHIPTAVYWTIRSIVACASQIMGLNGMRYEHVASTTEAWELSSLEHKVSNIHSHLKKQLALCHQHIDEKRQLEAYQTLLRLFETTHLDNMKILKALIYAMDDQLPLYDGSTSKRASVDVLRRKIVLLFISDLELSSEELAILHKMYSESETRKHPERVESQYEVVWLPVVDQAAPWNRDTQNRFETLQSQMPWYSLCLPSMLAPAVTRYIKEVWHFNKKPLLVVLDPQGKVVNHNAIPMMWIWGSLAFPFNSAWEESLWKEESWRVELLANIINPLLFNWIQDGKFICLYGGEDIEWIRSFTKKARDVAQEAGIELEMLYVGKSNHRDKVRKNIATILKEGLSQVLQDENLIWFFWVRLECMWQSKGKLNKTAENDPIMQEIMTMLSFDGDDQGWAVFSKGTEMAKGKGKTIFQAFTDFEPWRNLVEQKGFIKALNDQLDELHSPLHCNRLILPSLTGNIPERVVCAECGRPMEKLIMYRCCID